MFTGSKQAFAILQALDNAHGIPLNEEDLKTAYKKVSAEYFDSKLPLDIPTFLRDSPLTFREAVQDLMKLDIVNNGDRRVKITDHGRKYSLPSLRNLLPKRTLA